MDLVHPLLFEDLPGYTPHLSRLIAMMQYVRETTLHTAQGLDVGQLDHLAQPEGNSIGMLLAHIAAVEEGYYLATVPGVAEKVDWSAPALALGEVGRAALRGRPLEHYLTELERVRTQTLDGFLA